MTPDTADIKADPKEKGSILIDCQFLTNVTSRECALYTRHGSRSSENLVIKWEIIST